MRLLKATIVLAFLAAVAVGAFFGVRSLLDDDPEAGALERPVPIGPGPEVIELEARQPRFAGEMLGIWIAPRGVPIPDKFLTYDELCGAAPTVPVPWERAGQLDLNLQLPPQYVFEPNDLNTGVIACGDTVYAARWTYSVMPQTGYPASVVIFRSHLHEVEADAAGGRVKPIVAGGRPAVLVEPVTPDGVSSRSLVIFPEPFGKTAIDAAGLPLADLLEVAELVGQASKPGAGR